MGVPEDSFGIPEDGLRFLRTAYSIHCAFDQTWLDTFINRY
jgi:hypothetical protein